MRHHFISLRAPRPRQDPLLLVAFQDGNGLQLPLGLRLSAHLPEHLLLPGAGKVTELDEAQAIKAAAP